MSHPQASHNPNDPAICSALGARLMQAGDVPGAFHQFALAVMNDHKNPAYIKNFLNVFARVKLDAFSEWIKNIVIFCLKNREADFRHAARAWAWLYAIDPAFEAVKAWSMDSDTDYIRAFSDQYLLLGLQRAIIPDFNFEEVMTAARRKILLRRGELNLAAFEDFLQAMAAQNWMGERAWIVETGEKAALKELKTAIENGENEPADLFLYACYAPLHTLGNAKKLSPHNDGLKLMLKAQVADYFEEQEIQKTIPVHGVIDDKISQAVRAQYEENPYPRWTRAYTDDTPDERVKDVLIAGCGTGQQSAHAAARYPRAHIQNFDLSRASLAYAARQTRAMGLAHMSFTQADLLQLGTLNKTFDVIECIGVLHHMDKPSAGLKVLASLLKPDGALEIGLYSEAARADIVAAHSFIAKGGYGTSADDLRRLRHDVAHHTDPQIRRCSKSLDFYTLSACRDLLLHAKEHRFTIPAIQHMLTENGLKFVKFNFYWDIFENIFREKYPDAADLHDLEKWDAVEREAPHIFSSMYVFTAQRA